MSDCIQNVEDFIKNTVHHLYYTYDTNCARVTLRCLGTLFDVEISEQVWAAAVGMHGAGGFRAQCGLVEGGLLFLGIYGAAVGLEEAKIVNLCYEYGETFTKEFGSLRCRELRPGGFNKDDAPHMCEELTNRAILFTWKYIRESIGA